MTIFTNEYTTFQPLDRTQSSLQTQSQSKRKFSFPASLHSTSLLEVNHSISGQAKRRLSNVSDVVSRKLSYTIGWKAPQIPVQEIVTQGKCICGQYIKRKLRRSGLFNRKLGLQRIRSIIGTTTVSIVKEVFPAVNSLGDELERMHPRVYTGIARQVCRSPGGQIESIETVPIVLTAVSRDLFRNDITWSKIVSLFAVAAGLAVDCVRQGHPEYLPKLVEGITDIIEDDLGVWINENGGWTGLYNHIHPSRNGFTIIDWITLSVGCLFAIFIIMIFLR
uniref:Bcl-2 Bcl-2 homology region 1-3 domain-containing protein n=1 Tax=Megaselia scalaris TaxID=36166 RepID=T1H0W0_MEGSC